jgi:hypothetical protein
MENCLKAGLSDRFAFLLTSVHDLCRVLSCHDHLSSIKPYDTASIALRGGSAKLVRLPLLPLDRRPESIRPCIPEVNFSNCNHYRYRAQELAFQAIRFRQREGDPVIWASVEYRQPEKRSITQHNG